MLAKKIKIPVEVSAHHCHLSKEDLEKLFGVGYELKILKQLTQPSDFACQETVTIQLGAKKIENVRVVGPTRQQTQVEVSLTDAIGSGVIPPLRLSGNLQGSASVTIMGPAGIVNLKEGIIVAQRHIHCNPKEAVKCKVKPGDLVSVEVKGDRSIIFENVAVRVKENYNLCLHLDTDEGNSAGINKIGEGYI